MTFDPHIFEVTCVTIPKDHCVRVPWKYIKVCGYSEPFCLNLNQRSLTLDDLWLHICWGHMCDSTQGSLCLSPMGIHQCMWIQWSILQITTYILHTTYTHTNIHTTYRISDRSLFLNYVQARQKKKKNSSMGLTDPNLSFGRNFG